MSVRYKEMPSSAAIIYGLAENDAGGQPSEKSTTHDSEPSANAISEARIGLILSARELSQRFEF
jgi:hypothetical protein